MKQPHVSSTILWDVCRGRVYHYIYHSSYIKHLQCSTFYIWGRFTTWKAKRHFTGGIKCYKNEALTRKLRRLLYPLSNVNINTKFVYSLAFWRIQDVVETKMLLKDWRSERINLNGVVLFHEVFMTRLKTGWHFSKTKCRRVKWYLEF